MPSIKELQAGLISGRWTSVDLVEMYLERINQFSRYNAMIFVKDRESLLSEAASLDKERASWGIYSASPSSEDLLATPQGGVEGKKLHGIPIIVKDNICTSDMPTTAGALALKGAESGFDAEIVRKLRNAGAIILGKSNLTEMANFVDTHHTWGWSYMGGQTMNGISGSFHASGSSSGSACAVALGICPCSIGTETHGSIICPSVEQGIVGIKPSRGLCSNAGIIPISTSFDTAGPMGRTVEDVAVVLEALSNSDEKFSDLNAYSIKGTRAGVALKCIQEISDNDSAHVVYNLMKLVGELHTLGCTPVHEILEDKILSKLPHINHKSISALEKALNEDYYYLNKCEFKDGLADILTKFHNVPSNVRDLASLIAFNREHPEALNLMTKKQETLIESNDTNGIADTKYKPSLERVTASSKSVIDHIFKDGFDFLVTAFIGPDGPAIYDLAVMSGSPIITIPLGRFPDVPSYRTFFGFTNCPGVGYGLILIAKHGNDHKLLCYAKQIENMLQG
ncbi:amidase signature enzyme, partial [Coemansia reversa NRRL 1564]